jgi:hypothetical protein
LITFDEGVDQIGPEGCIMWSGQLPIDILKQLTKTVIKKEFPTDTRLFLDLLLGF